MGRTARISNVRKLDVVAANERAVIRANVEYFPGNVGEVSHFLFTEGQGAHTHEEVSESEGTISGATWGIDEDGRFLLFDGVDDEVDFGTSNIYHSGISDAVTWEIMIKPRTLIADGGFIWQKGSQVDTNAKTFLFLLDEDNNLLGDGRTTGGGGNVWALNGTGVIQWGRLTHIRMTYDDAASPKQNLYVNNMNTPVDTESTGSGNLANLSTHELKFGMGNNGIEDLFFRGNIYEAKIWDHAHSGQVLPI